MRSWPRSPPGNQKTILDCVDETFAEAFVNARHTVLGCALRPFSVWHSFALKLAESPFALTGDMTLKIDFPALHVAVEICRRGYDPELLALKAARSPLRFRFRMARFKGGYTRQLSAYFAYLRDFRSGPEHFWDSDLPPSAVESELILVGRMIRLAGMSKREAWETPLGEAMWLSVALIEAGGSRSNLLNLAEIKAMKAAGWLK